MKLKEHLIKLPCNFLELTLIWSHMGQSGYREALVALYGVSMIISHGLSQYKQILWPMVTHQPLSRLLDLASMSNELHLYE
jgi:hypothetical protein